MKKIIVIAGATGDLGERILNSLVAKGAEIRVIARAESNAEKLRKFESLGIKVYNVATWTVEELSKACVGASCVVSVLSGLRNVIVDAQKILLDAAVAAKVPRFIPSDYSLDFTQFSDGENRNLDLRREFHAYLDKKPISATSIFNGAFTDLLTGKMPLILFKHKLIVYWGSADHLMGFTTMDDTAYYTADVALDDSAPRYLRVAGDQISARQLRTELVKITGEKYRFFRAGSMWLLGILIKIARSFSPGEHALYPAWQGMQYMRNMVDKRSDLVTVDNERYSEMPWTKAKDVLSKDHHSKIMKEYHLYMHSSPDDLAT